MIFQRRNWPRLIGGILMLVGGLVGLFNPRIASATISAFLGAALMVSGALRIGFYLSGSKSASAWDMGTGVMDIIGAFFILANGAATATALSVLIGIYVIVQGALEIAASIRLKNLRQANAWWVGSACGGLFMLLGLLIIIHRAAVAVGMGVLLGLYLIVLGALAIADFFMEQRAFR